MNVEYVEGIPGELGKYFKKNKRNLIILDYRMDETWKSLKVLQLFTRGRHDNFSVIYLTQNLFHKNQRALSLISDYMVIFKNPQNIYNLLLSQDRYVQIRWNSLCGTTKMQYHLHISTRCFIWKQTLRGGFECKATFLKIHNMST